MSHDDRLRQPAGTPTGGQFAPDLNRAQPAPVGSLGGGTVSREENEARARQLALILADRSGVEPWKVKVETSNGSTLGPRAYLDLKVKLPDSDEQYDALSLAYSPNPDGTITDVWMHHKWPAKSPLNIRKTSIVAYRPVDEYGDPLTFTTDDVPGLADKVEHMGRIQQRIDEEWNNPQFEALQGRGIEDANWHTLDQGAQARVTDVDTDAGTVTILFDGLKDGHAAVFNRDGFITELRRQSKDGGYTVIEGGYRINRWSDDLMAKRHQNTGTEQGPILRELLAPAIQAAFEEEQQ